jgi:uncharacterized protein (DUF779 family)
MSFTGLHAATRRSFDKLRTNGLEKFQQPRGQRCAFAHPTLFSGVANMHTQIQTPEQVTATPAAIALIDELRAEHGDILFHQSGGCCDGSAPMCYPQAEFMVGDQDVHLGEIGGVPFYISKPQFEYWKHTQLIIDVVTGRGGMFSLENGRGVRFLTRSRLFEDGEIEALRASGRFGVD